MRTAAGYVLCSDHEADRRFLLLRNARHGTWSFPKGHLEAGESPEDGARRELAEETGIRAIRVLPGFSHEMAYLVSDRDGHDTYEKRVVLMLAVAEDPEWTRSAEHDAGGWMTEDEVRKRLSYDDLRVAFAAAIAHLAELDG